MEINGIAAAVSGGASGLGLATAHALVERGATVTIIDLPTSNGEEIAAQSGGRIRFAPADVTDEAQFAGALDSAANEGELRVVVHTAGRGARIRVVEKDGTPGDFDGFQAVQKLNVGGSFNAMRLGAARMAQNELKDGDRGVIILTSSVAAYEGQIGQIAYATSKAAVVGMTLAGARDLASKQIRVSTIAPGIFETPLFANIREDVREGLAQSVPHPRRLGAPAEYARLAMHIIENPYLNGETIRLDGAIRMAPR